MYRFCIGYPKTGTRSLHDLFLHMGLRSRHLGNWIYLEESCFKMCDCFLDAGYQDPYYWGDKYPDSLFIVTTRGLRDWVYSYYKWIDKVKGRMPFHKNLSASWDRTIYATCSWVLERNQNMRHALTYSHENPNRMLFVNLCRDDNAVERIQKFLNIDGEYEKPWRNASKLQFHPEYRDIFETSMRDLGVDEEYWDNDLMVQTEYADCPLTYPWDTKEIHDGWTR